MTTLIGEFLCKVDEKGRIALPSGLRKQFSPEVKERFVVNRGFERHLNLYPSNEWSAITSQLNQLNLFIKRNREFLRKFNNGAMEMDLDAAGRILLPKSLMDYAGISREVVLFAYANRIEIWNRADYESALVSDGDDFAGLAEDVMGNLSTHSTSDDSNLP